MAKKTAHKFEFAGMPINDIIGNPLVAIARAESMMAKEQLKSLLQACFKFKNGTYEPLLLQMTVTRSVIEPGQSPGDIPEIGSVTTYFNLPVITIFPINSLGIENADIDFGIEITSQYRANNEKDSLNTATDMGFLGKINTFSSDQKSDNPDNTTSLRVNVKTKTRPLSKGLLEIINVYSNAIQSAIPNKND